MRSTFFPPGGQVIRQTSASIYNQFRERPLVSNSTIPPISVRTCRVTIENLVISTAPLCFLPPPSVTCSLVDYDKPPPLQNLWQRSNSSWREITQVFEVQRERVLW